MTTTGERARVERWAVSDPRGEQFWYCSNEQEAKERAANWSKFEHLPYRAFLLREVDPAHDSAVARLCEAARELSRVSLLWVKNCPCGCGSCASTERALEVLDTALSDPALTGAAKGEQEPPAMADQTSGIRCGRCGRSLRERVLDKSGRKCEMCDPRPPMEATHSMNVQPAMPPEGTKVRCWRHKDGFKDGVDRVRWDGVLMWFIRNDAEPRVATLTVKQAEEAVERGSWVECPDAPYIPPTPPQPSGESAEAVADRVVVLGGGPGTRVEYAKKVAKLIRSRDAAHQARHAAEVARLFAESERVCAEAAKALDERDDARRAIAAKDAEIARLKSRIAAPAIDRELLETARAAMAAIIAKRPYRESTTNDPDYATMARGAVAYARALHTALANGEVGR